MAISRLKRGLRALLRKDAVEGELDEELSYHLARQIEQNISEGMKPEDARAAALRAFGGVEQAKEECREARGIKLIEDLWQDLRYGFRALFRNRGFTFVAVLALMLGVGANTAIFSIVNALILRPLPYKDAGQLVWVWGNNQQLGVNQGYLSNADIFDFQKQSTQFESIAAWTTLPVNLIEDNRSERLEGILVSPNFFGCLGVRIEVGRDFMPDEAREDRNQVVIISDAMWRRRFGGDPDVIGKQMTLGRYETGRFTIVGVAPPEVQFPVRTDIWMPEIDAPEDNKRGGHDLRAVARLKQGATLEQAEAELNLIAQRLEQQYPASNTGWRVSLTRVRDLILGTPYKALWMLLGAVTCVLLIACANVANLQLARSINRSREIALRTALGASRRRIIRQLLTESLLLALIGGALGLLLAWWGVQGLRVIGPDTIPRLQQAGIDGRVLLFTVMLTILTGIAFGLFPALQVSRPDLNETLKEGARSATVSGNTNRTRSLLIIVEVAVTVLLLVGTGLLLKSFWRLRNVDPGFRADHVLSAGISLDRDKYMQDDSRRVIFFQQVLERIRSLPDVESAGMISHLPFGGRGVNLKFTLPGRDAAPGDDTTRAELRVISPDYFETMRIPLSSGRSFTEQDTESQPAVVIVNEAFARQFFHNESPLGKRLQIQSGEKPFRSEIVGVAGDVRHRGYDAEPRPEMYVSYLQNTVWPVMNLVIRTRTEPNDMAAVVRKEIEAVDASQAIFNVRPLEGFLSDSIAERRFNLMLLIAFAAVSLLTATAGIYGVMSYTVTQRTHEIGIRMALGASSRNILRLVVSQGMALTLAGVALGLACAFIGTRIMSSLLYGVSATDSLIFVGVPLLLVAVALVACLLPARRAMKVDPMVALRYE